MSIAFSADYMFVDNATFLSPSSVSSLNVWMGNEVIRMEDLELQNDTDPLAGAGDLTVVNLQYEALTLVA